MSFKKTAGSNMQAARSNRLETNVMVPHIHSIGDKVNLANTNNWMLKAKTGYRPFQEQIEKVIDLPNEYLLKSNDTLCKGKK